MPKIDLDTVEQTNRTSYPMPYAAEMGRRHYRRLGEASGLKDIGVSQIVIEPGGISSQRHWHEGIDEFVVMLDGEAVLVEDDGETVMRAGDCAAFPKDSPNGHHFVNRSERNCTFIAVDGRLSEGDCHYPDADLHWDQSAGRYIHKDGTPYDAERR